MSTAKKSPASTRSRRLLWTVAALAAAAIAAAVAVVLRGGGAGGQASTTEGGRHVHGRDHAEGEAGHGEHGGEHGDEHGEAHVIHLSPEQLEELEITVVRARKGPLTATVELPGTVEWNTDRLLHVSPRVSGVVARVEKTLGDRVEPGDLLCILDSRETGDAKMRFLADLRRFGVAEADFSRARTVHDNTKKLLEILARGPAPAEALSQASDIPVGDIKNKLLTSYTRMRVNERNYQRIKGLLEKKIASEADYLRAMGDHEVARADFISTREEIIFDLELSFLRAQRDFTVAETEVKNSERALHILGIGAEELAALREGRGAIDEEISRTPISCPMQGIIVERHLTHGELVKTGTRLYTIADPSEVWVIGRVYERDLRFLKVGQRAAVHLDAFPDLMIDGVVDYLGSQLDPATRTVEARVVLGNEEGRFRPGMFGSVTVFTEHAHSGPRHESAVLVPLAALQRSSRGLLVFRPVKPGKYEAVPVRVVASSRELAEITGKIEPGDEVVSGETFILKSEMEKAETGGDNGH